MKQSLIALSLVLMSSLAHADLAEKINETNCNSPATKALMGERGSCRIIVSTKKIDKRGICTGTFMGSLPCVVSFISIKDQGAAMNLTCGADPKAPVIDQDMEAEAVGFNVATLIKKTDGQDVVLNDKNEYGQLSNRMLDVTLVETVNAGVKTTSGTILISLQSGQVPLSAVNCQLQ